MKKNNPDLFFKWLEVAESNSFSDPKVLLADKEKCLADLRIIELLHVLYIQDLLAKTVDVIRRHGIEV